MCNVTLMSHSFLRRTNYLLLPFKVNYLFSYRHNKRSVFKIATNLDLLASSSLVGS